MEDRSFPTRNSMALDNALGLLKKKKKRGTGTEKAPLKTPVRD